MALTQNQKKALNAASTGILKRSGVDRKSQRIFIDKASGRPETVTLATLNSLVSKGLVKDLPAQGDPYEPLVYPITEKGKNELGSVAR